MEVQYVTNEKGKKKAVLISLKQWSEMKKKMKKIELFEELKQGFHEIHQFENGEINTPTTQQLLDQL